MVKGYEEGNMKLGVGKVVMNYGFCSIQFIYSPTFLYARNIYIVF